MKYSISFKNPLTHFFNVSLELNTTHDDAVTLALPIWRPGRYEAANYAKNIRGLKITDKGGKAISYTKVNPSTWKLDTRSADSVLVTYDYFAFKMDAGNSWYDPDLIYINFVNCMIYATNQMDEKCEVEIDIPDHYKIGCGLNRSAKTFNAKDYYELVDSPLMASANMEHYEYSSEGSNCHIWINGRHSLDTERLVKDCNKFTDEQIRTMGEFPEKEYHFLYHLLPYKFYHGVEHHDSTVICLGPGAAAGTDEAYSQLMGVSSHELFHAWNIIKIRPKEIMPYDFGKLVTFPTGYVAEGFTTYYGDIFLVRSGVFDRSWFFKELNTLFKRHFLNFGRLNYSVTDSSLDLWIDGYAITTPERKSSIYIEGAMVALCLDLMIRKKSNNDRSLDDVMRALWKRYGKQNKGYSFEDVQEICEEYYGDTLDNFFRNHVKGTAPKEDLINELLYHVGCQLIKGESESNLEKYFGLRVSDGNGGLKISQIAPDSIGEQHFSINDELISINNSPVSIDKINSFGAAQYNFKINRNYKDVEVNLEAGNERYFTVYKIEPVLHPSESQRESFSKWLGCEL